MNVAQYGWFVFLISQIGSLPILVCPFDLSFVCYGSKLELKMRVGRNL